MSLEVIYYDKPVNAGEKYTALSQGFCDLSLLNYKRDYTQTPYEPIITLEPDNWVLDGSRVALKAYAPPPFWGRQLSDFECELSEPAVVTVTLSKPCTASGVTAIFWEESQQWCSRVMLSWYSGNTLLARKTVYPESPRLVVQKLVEDFDRLEFSMERTSLPYRFPRLSYLQIGQEITFRDDSLVGVTLLTEHDPTGCKLSADTMTVEVYDESHIITAQENQPLELYRDGKLIASQNITASRRTGQHSYTFTAQSMVGILEEQFYGGVYDGAGVWQLMSEILNAQDGFEVDGAFNQQAIFGYLPVCTRREALQQLAFVLGARVDTSDGIIRLLSMEQQITGAFLPEEIFSGAQLETQSKLVKLEVTAHSYTPGNQEQVLMDNVYVDGENVTLVLDTPCTECRVEGGRLVNDGANFITVTAHGNIRVLGKPYIHTAVIHSRRLPGSGSVLTVDSATLVSHDNVESVMDRLMAAAAPRQKLTQSVVLNEQFAGQLVESPTPWGGTLTGCITSLEAHMTPRGQTATVTIQGSEGN